VHIL